MKKAKGGSKNEPSWARSAKGIIRVMNVNINISIFQMGYIRVDARSYKIR